MQLFISTKGSADEEIVATKEKTTNVSIVLEGRSNNGTLVSLNDWLDAKHQLLALIFDLRKDASCQATTKDIQYELLRCPDETLQISGRSYEGHKIQFPYRPWPRKIEYLNKNFVNTRGAVALLIFVNNEAEFFIWIVWSRR